jgi:hypothetical protein
MYLPLSNETPMRELPLRCCRSVQSLGNENHLVENARMEMRFVKDANGRVDASHLLPHF